MGGSSISENFHPGLWSLFVEDNSETRKRKIYLVHRKLVKVDYTQAKIDFVTTLNTLKQCDITKQSYQNIKRIGFVYCSVTGCEFFLGLANVNTPLPITGYSYFTKIPDNPDISDTYNLRALHFECDAYDGITINENRI